MDVFLYDTTLRDGTQREGLSLSVEDKLKVARLLDTFGMHYIEGGWPGSNPKDAEFFRRMREHPLVNARLAAFGSTRRANSRVEEDGNLRALLDAETPVVTLVGKSSTLHVTHVLETTLEENLAMIAESVRFMKQHGKEVVYDAEHFFDGFRLDPDYTLKTITAAAEAGADWVVLCDTNGGSLPNWVQELVLTVKKYIATPVGIHTHNDGELAVANSLVAIQAGAAQVQGTINGYGERCGNANLVSIIPNLQLKLGYRCLPEANLAHLAELSRTVSEIANLSPDSHAPFVGVSAFAHKGGIHVAAVEKITSSYEHLNPELVGNKRRFVVSELSGRGNIRVRASELGLQVDGNERALLEQIKQLESKGFQFEAADGSFELLVRRHSPGYAAPFEILTMAVRAEQRRGDDMTAEATVKLRVNDQILHTAAEGDGPVDALDHALRKALVPCYPALAQVHLADYKVRILDPESATAATTRVLIEAACGEERWTTIGCSQNILEASCQALADSFELHLLRSLERQVSAQDAELAGARAAE